MAFGKLYHRINELDIAISWFDNILKKYTCHYKAYEGAIQVALDKLDFSLAAKYISNAQLNNNIDSIKQLSLKVKNLERSYDLINMTFKENTVHDYNYPIFVVNLDSDKDRLKQIQRRADQLGLPIRRFPAVDISRLEEHEYVCDVNRKIDNGAIGCFLSHVGIYKEVISENIDNALILEDDSWPILPLPCKIGRFNLPENYDLVFVNESMEFNNGISINKDDSCFECTNIDEVSRYRSFKYPNQRNVGTYGYFISKKGAEKLLKIFEEEGICNDIDWTLLSHSVTRRGLENMNQYSHRARRLKKYHDNESEIKLNGYVISPIFVGTRDWGSNRFQR